MPALGLEDGAQPEQPGRVMQLYGRRMQPNNKLHNQPRHLYFATPLRGVWNEAALLARLEIILCESLIDAMTFWYFKRAIDREIKLTSRITQVTAQTSPKRPLGASHNRSSSKPYITAQTYSSAPANAHPVVPAQRWMMPFPHSPKPSARRCPER